MARYRLMKIDWSFAMIRILFTTVNVMSASTLRKKNII
jgi:hypothetical protein